MSTLTVFQKDGLWWVRSRGNAKWLAAFGSDVCVLPFTAQAKAALVCASLERLYPKAIIVVDHGDESNAANRLGGD